MNIGSTAQQLIDIGRASRSGSAPLHQDPVRTGCISDRSHWTIALGTAIHYVFVMLIRRRAYRAQRGPQVVNFRPRRFLALMMFVLGLLVWGGPVASARLALEDGMATRSMTVSHQDGCDDGCCDLMPVRCPAPCALPCLMLPMRTVAFFRAEALDGEWEGPLGDLRTGREIDVDDPPPRR